jgi:hypothetical protein
MPAELNDGMRSKGGLFAGVVAAGGCAAAGAAGGTGATLYTG